MTLCCTIMGQASTHSKKQFMSVMTIQEACKEGLFEEAKLFSLRLKDVGNQRQALLYRWKKVATQDTHKVLTTGNQPKPNDPLQDCTQPWPQASGIRREPDWRNLHSPSHPYSGESRILSTNCFTLQIRSYCYSLLANVDIDKLYLFGDWSRATYGEFHLWQVLTSFTLTPV